MLEDPADYVQLGLSNVPVFSGKRKPEYVLEYRSQLKELSEDDENRVVRVRADGALKAIETAADKENRGSAVLLRTPLFLFSSDFRQGQ